jgi:hypothetical protein
MTEHQDQADRLEAEADQLEKQSAAVGEDIAKAKDQREEMRRDETIPGVPAEESGLPPEANYTTRGDQPPEGPGDDQDERAPWPDE